MFILTKFSPNEIRSPNKASTPGYPGITFIRNPSNHSIPVIRTKLAKMRSGVVIKDGLS